MLVMESWYTFLLTALQKLLIGNIPFDMLQNSIYLKYYTEKSLPPTDGITYILYSSHQPTYVTGRAD